MVLVKEITNLAPYLSYISDSFGENRRVFPIVKIHEIKEESLRFLGFLARDLDQMRGAH